MRLWIEYLINNQNAYNDFIQYMEESISHLAAETANAVIRDDVASTQKYASEREMYIELKRVVKKEFTERISINKYNEQFKERS